MITNSYWTVTYNLPTGIFVAIVPYTKADCERDAAVLASIEVETNHPNLEAIYNECSGYADGLVQQIDTSTVFYPEKIVLK